MMSLLSIVLFACTGAEPTPAVAAPTSAVPKELLATTWQVRMAVDAARAPFEGRAAWKEMFGAHPATALPAFVSESDPVGAARIHASYAAIYREAARLAANATVQVYGVDAQPTDPAEVSYLLGVSGSLLGDATYRARLGAAAASKVDGAAGALSARDAAWKAWAAAGAVWPPDALAAQAPGAPSGDAIGALPDAGALPHWVLPEREGGLSVDAGDPATLWALARWHEARARGASPEAAPLVDLLLDPWRLPPEARVGHAAAEPTAVPDSWLFLSAWSNAADAAFLADLEASGSGAVARWAATSPHAAVVQKCATPGPGPSVDCMVDETSALVAAVTAAMGEAAGREDSFHRPFAELARVGALRAGVRAALAAGASDDAARLRVLALDRSVGTAADPLFTLSVAAWDAGNRNSVRAEELVHGVLSQVPGLEAARLPLDALHVRLSRNAAPGRPSH